MRSRKLVGGLMILGGLILGGMTLLVMLATLQSSSTFNSPGSTTVSLQPGRWTIFERAPEDGSYGSIGDVENARTVAFEQLSVTASDGTKIALNCAYCSGQSIATPLDFSVYNAVADFRVTTAGSFVIASTHQGGQLAVGDPAGALADIAPWLSLLVMASFALFVAGILLLVIRKARRSGPGTPPPTGIPQQRPPVSANSSPPPGWYPNPYLSDDSQMWWNGSEWTSNWR